jgi:Mn2+/Fe2+ NRAMP family transporter
LTVKASPANSNRDPVVEPNKPRLLRVLGLGLITGAADDDPSGIATYAQTGAQFGYATTYAILLSADGCSPDH